MSLYDSLRANERIYDLASDSVVKCFCEDCGIEFMNMLFWDYSVDVKKASPSQWYYDACMHFVNENHTVAVYYYGVPQNMMLANISEDLRQRSVGMTDEELIEHFKIFKNKWGFK